MIAANLQRKIAQLPNSPGVYQFYDSHYQLIYVGKSISIKKRVASYFSQKNLGPKTDLLVKRITDIGFIKVFSEFEALLLEAQLIKKHQPFFNTVAKDDKSPRHRHEATSGQQPPAGQAEIRQQGPEYARGMRRNGKFRIPGI